MPKFQGKRLAHHQTLLMMLPIRYRRTVRIILQSRSTAKQLLRGSGDIIPDKRKSKQEKKKSGQMAEPYSNNTNIRFPGPEVHCSLRCLAVRSEPVARCSAQRVFQHFPSHQVAVPLLCHSHQSVLLRLDEGQGVQRVALHQGRPRDARAH